MGRKIQRARASLISDRGWQLSPAIHASLLVVVISAAGFIAHRKEVIKQGHSSSLTNLLIKILMPALIFSSITQNEAFLSSNLVSNLYYWIHLSVKSETNCSFPNRNGYPLPRDLHQESRFPS